MNLTPAMERFVLHWGEMGSRWGVNRSVAQIHALLYLAQEPLCAEDIAQTLGIARSNVSNSLKELQSWDLIAVTHVLSDRRDHFQAEQDIWSIITTVADGRKRREIDPTVVFLKSCVTDLETDRDTPAEVKARIGQLLEFTEELSTWYEQVKSLPQSSLLQLMRLGAGIGKLLRR